MRRAMTHSAEFAHSAPGQVAASPPPPATPLSPPATSPHRPAAARAGILVTTEAAIPVPAGPGRHPAAGDRACLMELASLLAREPWGDHPASVHPVLAAVARAVSDRVSDEARNGLAAL